MAAAAPSIAATLVLTEVAMAHEARNQAVRLPWQESAAAQPALEALLLGIWVWRRHKWRQLPVLPSQGVLLPQLPTALYVSLPLPGLLSLLISLLCSWLGMMLTDAVTAPALALFVYVGTPKATAAILHNGHLAPMSTGGAAMLSAYAPDALNPGGTAMPFACALAAMSTRGAATLSAYAPDALTPGGTAMPFAYALAALSTGIVALRRAEGASCLKGARL